MNITVVCEYADGSRQACGDAFDDLCESVSFALDLADRFGSTKGDGHGPPALVHVIEDMRTELTIRVLRGGLSPAVVQ